MTITTLGRSTAHAVGWLFSDAFHHEPLATWIVPDPFARPALMARFFAIVAAEALRDGLIDLTDDAGDGEEPWAEGGQDGVLRGQAVGAALWFEYADLAPAVPSAQLRPDPDLDAQVVDALGPPAAARWWTATRAMAERHPAGAHHYLALVGVAGDRQGRGVGERLLRHRLRLLDAALAGAYLEATSPASRALYLRSGFRDLGRPFDLPDGGPRIWPMFRDPYPHGHPRP